MVKFKTWAWALAGAALLVPAQALSTEYHLLDGDKDIVVLIDKESMSRSGSLVRSSLVSIFRDTQTVGGRQIAFMEVVIEFDCSQNRSRDLVFSGRDEAGLLTDTVNADPVWRDIGADTAESRWKRQICDEGIEEEPTPTTDLKILREAFLSINFDD